MSNDHQSDNDKSSYSRYKELILEFMIDNKAIMLIIIIWIAFAEFSENSVFILLRNLVNMLIFPINILFFGTTYDSTLFPKIFFLLIPSVIIIGGGFFYLLYSED